MSEYNILLVGEQGVGKTSYRNKLSRENFATNIGENTTQICFPMLDSLFQEQASPSAPLGGTIIKITESNTVRDYSEFDGVMVMFDKSNMVTFQNVEMWIDLIELTNIPLSASGAMLGHERNANIPIILLGNKGDLAPASENWEDDETYGWAEDNDV